MDFPIQLKYLSIIEGVTQIHKEGDTAVQGYEMKDAAGVTVASGTSLANLFEYALQVDASYELMYQFLARGYLKEMKHLEDVDCDDTGPSGLALASAMPPKGGPGGMLLN